MGRRYGNTYSKYGVDLSAEGKKKRQHPDYFTGEMIQFDSELEKDFYVHVVVPQLIDGTIVKAELQKKYELQPTCKYQGQTIRAVNYVADFFLVNADGSELVVDVKGGMVDSVAKLKKKMMHYIYPDVNYVWMTKVPIHGWVEWSEYEKLKKEKSKRKKK